jgi:GTP-binding protein
LTPVASPVRRRTGDAIEAPRDNPQMFLDRVKIFVKAGAGGDGAATFRREAHVPRGGPDGGDGGRGGSIRLRVDAGETTLGDFRYRHHFKAQPGGRGERARRHGAAGADLELVVPPGTAVLDDETGALIADLVAVGQSVMIVRGGRGGLGNTHFKTATHQAPKHAQKGEPGEERWIRLELRLIADIGLVGLPNAGKSTLLAALTAARPKIADYPFTTLEPNLGVLDLAGPDGTGDDERRPTIADVPGLIEGASSGAGLGHAFLRHVERTRILLHVVDGSGRDPEWDHGVIRDELEAHDPALLLKPIVVVFNKLDQPAAVAAWPAFRAARRAAGEDVLAISAVEGTGLEALRERIAALLPDAAELEGPPEPAGVVVHRIDAMGDGFLVEREEDGAFRVRGRRIERIAAQTNFEVEESAERFQRDLARLGIDDELRRAGVVPGDVVRIGATELEWEGQPWEDR